MIWLRALGESDRGLLYRWRNLPDVRRWMYTDHVIEREEHDRWFSAVMVDRSKRYWVIMRDEEPLGVVNLVGLGHSADTCSLGIYLGEAPARGVGVARTALEQALDYAFSLPTVRSVAAEALHNNRDAAQLYAKVGMRRRKGEVVGPGGKLAVRYQMSRQRWLKRQPEEGSIT